MTRLELSKQCRDRRTELGMTQQQLGDKLGLPKTRVSEFENGKSNLQCDTLLEWLGKLQMIVTKK